MHRPLTAARALARALGGGGPAAQPPVLGTSPRPAVLHVAAARFEIDSWPLFLELACLGGGGAGLHVAFVGPEVPEGWGGACALFAAPRPPG